MRALNLENLLKSEIPISKEMDIQNLQLSADHLSLTLPLHPNRNHKGTLFGGSLYAGCALSCYGLFLAGLEDKSFFTQNIVISEGTMKYIAPVDQDAKIQASWGTVADKDQFFKTLESKKRARIVLRAQVFVGDKVCAEFSGQFVAQL